MANFYDDEEVKRMVSVRQYLKDQGVPMRGNRCAATWRGGDDLTCAIYDTKGENAVYDNKAVRRLNVIDLCMMVEGKSFADAKVSLGDRYGVTPTKGRKRTARKAKPAPNWVRVSWLIINAKDDAHMAEAYEHLNAGGDWPTYTDLVWARRVVSLLESEMIGSTLDMAMTVAGQLYLANEGMTAKKEAK